MMRRLLHIALAFVVLAAVSCTREQLVPYGEDLPMGVSTMLTIPFGAQMLPEVNVGTKADAGVVNESHIHDIYVYLFDKQDNNRKVYGRYFNFEHKESTLAALNARNSECWYVENKDLEGGVDKTRGAVKISTVTRPDVVVVLLANVDNDVTTVDADDVVGKLNAVTDLEELRSLSVSLEQDVVNRKNLFLMLGTLGYEDGRTVSTADMHWNNPVTSDSAYDPDYRVVLRSVNAKVRFRIKYNPVNISAVTPVYWQVCSTPNSCYLFSDFNGGKAPEDIRYFDSQQYYFEGTDTDPATGDTYYSFSFYMLENRLSPTRQASSYYQRELRNKNDSGESGYAGPSSAEYGDHYVDNGDWTYANANSTYVKFNLVLTLTPEGITDIGGTDPAGMGISEALTSNAVFTVHLGDFGSSAGTSGVNNYDTERGTFYTYTITVNNTKSIYTEVTRDQEVQAAQEGFLLLTDKEIFNVDAHYDYRSIEFPYRPDLDQEVFSWYVKTPFSVGGPTITKDPSTGTYTYDATDLDYLWVKFRVNKLSGGSYSANRLAYPGDGHYHPDWEPGRTVDDGDGLGPKEVPDLLDITQLIKFIFAETAKEKASPGSSAFKSVDGGTPVIRMTAFVNEYYYEENPLTGQVDPDLWRKFVNADPREMHILSEVQHSRDRQSDLITSSHSVIQQSIQTIYNIYAADLHTLWGTEHRDEMNEIGDGWYYWVDYRPGNTGRAGAYNSVGKENGRLNSAYIWDFYSSQGNNGTDRTGRRWDTYLNYDVPNDYPALREDYQSMAWSCMARNRDNNGNGFVDRDEVRWYLAASDQLIGMWVGNEALSLDARLYRPAEGQWRNHVVSSTDRRVCWSEEGAGATPYDWDFESGRHTWNTIDEAARGESVRCLRNIGTYDDGGTVKDISYAPYSVTPDHYFTLTEGADGSQTFHFDRLNPKSLRDYTEGDLPFATQFSTSNRVYLQMTAQPATNGEEIPIGKVMLAANEDVTNLGYNPYCPPGYRFPNQTELALMSMYLPGAYFGDGDKGYLPTRTYYDRGIIGNVSTNMSPDEVSYEKRKIGWGLGINDHRTHCAWAAEPMTHARCVRDNDQTGYIDGSVTLSSSSVCPGDQLSLTLSFFSTASAFVYASLKFCYTDHAGNYREREVPLQEAPNGLQYQTEQLVEIPSLAELGLVVADLDTDLRNMKFKAEMRNAMGMSKTFEAPFELGSNLTRCAMTFPPVSDPERGMPVRIDIGSRNGRANLTGVVLHWKAADAASFQEIVLVEPGAATEYHGELYAREIIGEDAWATEANRTKEYVFYVTAGCEDGTDYASPTVSQQVLRLNYAPNPTPAGGWTNISQCQTTWQNRVESLNFSRGDYIEADMDLRNCVYVYLGGTDATDLGKDNLIGFSTNNLGDIKNSTMWYYPSVQNQVAPPGDTGWTRMRVHAGRWAAKEYTGVVDRLNLILDKDGLIRDGARFTDNPGDWNTRVKALLTSASTILVGSVEGSHQSRAIYNYVRVVRYKDDAVTPVPRP